MQFVILGYPMYSTDNPVKMEVVEGTREQAQERVKKYLEVGFPKVDLLEVTQRETLENHQSNGYPYGKPNEELRLWDLNL